MTIEQELKEYILEHYGNLREFCKRHDLTYTTIDTILKRGINRAGVNNVAAMCAALGISLDGLTEGRIEKAAPAGGSVENVIEKAKKEIMTADGLTIGGRPATDMDIISVVESLDFILAYQRNNQRLRDRIEEYAKRNPATDGGERS